MEEKKDTKSRYFKGIKDTANNTVKKGISFGKETTSRFNQSRQVQNVKTNASPIFGDIKSKSTKTISEGIKHRNGLEKLPNIIRNIGSESLNALEKFVGKIRIGTQYGKTSLDVLEELAKMKELGIISEEEYLKKKKEIFDRI